MMTDSIRLRIVVAVVVIVLGSAAAVASHTLSSKPSEPLSEVLPRILACGQDKNPISCTRPIIKWLLEKQSAAAIMTQLQAKVSPQSCHYVGHVVGQQTYIKYKNVETALNACNRECDSACPHGVIGEIMAEQLGFGTPEDDQDIDLQHISVDDIRKVGKTLCTDAEACHGVGHAVFQSTRDMKKAMVACENIGTNVSACFNGVAMEYADILATRNMRDVPDVTFPSVDSLSTLCPSLPDLAKQRSCFRYFGRMVTETLVRAGYSEDQASEEVKKICYAYSSVLLQTACFSGVGSRSAYFVLTDQSRAIQACKELEGSRNQAACFFGQVAVAVEERQDKLLAYCPKIPTKLLQSECYHTIFYYLVRFNAPTENALAVCEKDPICRQTDKDPDVLPWDVIAKDFEL